MRLFLVGVAVLVLAACEVPPDPNTGGGAGGGSTTGGGAGGGQGGGGGGGGSASCTGSSLYIGTDTTWSGVMAIDCDVQVAATLTIAAGSTITFAAGKKMEVTGSLHVDGTAAAPVVMTGASVWGPVVLAPSAPTRTLWLKHVTIRNAGEAAPVEAARHLGAGLVLDWLGGTVLVDTVTVDGATGVGVVLREGAFAAGSTGLTVTNSGSYALFVRQPALGTIPTGSYASNAKPAVLVGSAWTSRYSSGGDVRIITDTVIRKLDVPYVFGTGDYKTDLAISTVQGGPPTFATIPLVTIEAGVEIRFARPKTTQVYPSLVNVDSAPDNGVWKPLGALRAVGTAAAPITFTSAAPTPAPGDWATIALEELDARTQLDHVVIAYAGGDARAIGSCVTGSPTAGGGSDKDGDAALQVFFNSGAPTRALITNSVLRDSAGGGIYRAWSGADLNLTLTNTFSNIAWCQQTPVVVTTTCVANPACP